MILIQISINVLQSDAQSLLHNEQNVIDEYESDYEWDYYDMFLATRYILSSDRSLDTLFHDKHCIDCINYEKMQSGKIGKHSRTYRATSVPALMMPSNVDTMKITGTLQVNVLASLRQWAICYTSNGLDGISERIYRDSAEGEDVLVWAEITDSARIRKLWALLILVKNTAPDKHWCEYHLFPGHPPNLLKVYDHRPSNMEVYDFLDKNLYTGKRPMFDFRFDPADCGNEACGCGVFVDGAVRQDTWKKLIGEAPTRFFPNGK